MNTDRGVWCVVPAAGVGERFGGSTPKQYAIVNGHAVLWHTLHRLGSHPDVTGIVLVLAADDELWREHLGNAGETGYPTSRPVHLATGGHTRADSVLAGLEAIPSEVGPEAFVMVHDAARPCVRHADISALLEAVGDGDGGLLATPVADTLKRADAEQHVASTEPRQAYWRAQTPQMFRRDALTAALTAARVAGIAITDEAMAMEHAGTAPLLVAGSEDNIKITHRVDLAVAGYLLENQA